jgi:hypothetical protein
MSVSSMMARSDIALALVDKVGSGIPVGNVSGG